MTIGKLLARLSLLTVTLAVLGAVTILFARSGITALAPQEANNGQITGTVSGVITNRPFTITANGVLSDNVTTYVSTTTALVGAGGNYAFNNMAAGSEFWAGYFSIVTYTVSAAAPASCYTVTPVSRVVYLTSTTPSVGGINFAAAYQSIAATLTARITEALFSPTAIPSTPIIIPPARSNGTTNLVTVTFRITSTDSTFTPQILTATASSGVVQFTGLLNSEPLDGTCGRTFGVTVLSVQPPYKNLIGWKLVPANAMQTITLSPSAPQAELGFLAYHYWSFLPIVLNNY